MGRPGYQHLQRLMLANSKDRMHAQELVYGD
jgi:hypothetical protein